VISEKIMNFKCGTFRSPWGAEGGNPPAGDNFERVSPNTASRSKGAQPSRRRKAEREESGEGARKAVCERHKRAGRSQPPEGRGAERRPQQSPLIVPRRLSAGSKENNA